MSLLAERTARRRVVLTEGRETPRRPDRAKQTIHRIVAFNLVALLALLSAGYVIGARLAEGQALRDASRLTHFVAETVVGPRLTGRLVAGDPEAVDELDRLFRDDLVHNTSIRRIKVWGADGTLLYSNDHDDIGTVVDLNADLQDLLAGPAGAVSAEVSDMEDAENVHERTAGLRLLEVYARVDTEQGAPALFEAYIDHEDLRDRRSEVFNALGSLTGILVGVFAAAQAFLARFNLRWLRRRQADLDRLSAEVNDRERRRVARDLHDGAVQELVGLSFLVEGASASVRRGDTRLASRMLDQCLTSVQTSVQSLRSTIVEVYPHVLEDRGLEPALGDLVQPLTSRGVAVEVRVEGEEQLPAALVAATYRAAQEMVRNISRHAQASHATIEVVATADTVRLTVADDGVGLDPDQLATRGGTAGHLGLQALADTALELDGRLDVASAPGHGTEVIWEVPL